MRFCVQNPVEKVQNFCVFEEKCRQKGDFFVKCPKCGKEMREGYLAARHPLIFTQDRRKMTLVCFGDDVKLTGTFQLDNPDARICETCRWVILDY